MHENVTAALRTLGVAVTPEALDAALSAAEKESLSHLEFLHRLLAGPAEARLQRALERRVRDAKFRELTTLDGLGAIAPVPKILRDFWPFLDSNPAEFDSQKTLLGKYV